jgi:hypothetical protein
MKLTRRGDAPAIGWTNDEVDALKAERDLWEQRTKEGAEIIEGNCKKIDALKANQDRLRAALEEITNAPYWAERPEMIKMARRALEGE